MTAVDEHQAATTHIADRLAALGTDPDAISTALIAAGATGRRQSPNDCPVARYLRADTTLQCERACITGVQTFVELRDGDSVHLDTPPAVHAFLTAFDSGAYPQLISGGTR